MGAFLGVTFLMAFALFSTMFIFIGVLGTFDGIPKKMFIYFGYVMVISFGIMILSGTGLISGFMFQLF